jgi:small subunit ribosomal protein S1
MDINFKTLKVGQTVVGTVINVSANEIRLDLQSSLEGQIYLDQYDTEPHTSFVGLIEEGDQVQAVVKKIDEQHGQVLLSRIAILQEESLKQLVATKQDQRLLTAKVLSANEHGLLFKLFGFEAFMHISQVDFNVTDLSAFVNQELTFYVTDVDMSKRSIKLSRTKYLVEQRIQQKDDEYEKLTIGKTYKVTIQEIKSFGVFVDFTYNRGFLPLGEIAHEHVTNPSDYIQVGDVVEVKLIEKKLQKNKPRITVSRKRLLETPFDLFAKAHKKGQTIQATVINKLPFGLIVEVAPHVTGLLHDNEISFNPNDNFKASVVHGTVIDVAILAIDKAKQRISLSKKALESNPWKNVTVRRGDVVSAVVSEVNVGKGFTVIVQGVDAVLPVTELKEGPVGKLEELYAIGETIDVVVSKCFADEWLMEVSVLQLQSQRERKQFDSYIKTQETRSVTLGDLFGKVLEKKRNAAPAPIKPAIKASAPKEAAKPVVQATSNVASLSVKELKELAKAKGIAGYTTMKKADLIAALQ